MITRQDAHLPRTRPRLRKLSAFAWAASLAILCLGCAARSRAAERAFLAGDDDTAIDEFQKRRAVARTDYALECSLLGSAALNAGDYRTSLDALVDAGRVMGSFPGNTPSQVAALIGRESLKIFRGDPYEAVMNSIYTALLCLERGDEENARAAVKRGILADSDSKEEQYRSDVIALYSLAALLEVRSDQVELARKDIEHLQAIDPQHPYADVDFLRSVNAVIWIDSGRGPTKIGTGSHGAIADFSLHAPAAATPELRLDGERLPIGRLGVDLGFQATTRGGRTMDQILAGKAAAKDVMIASGAVLLNEAAKGRRSGQRSGLLAVIGGGLLLLGTMIQPQADLRHWHLLPAEGHLWMGRVEPGLHTLEIEFENRRGIQLPEYRQIWHYLPFRNDRLEVYYFRGGYHKGFRRTPPVAAVERTSPS
ncbi:MAG: hypothetical protein ACKVX7_13035 [Planctomycetota bacterium]